MDAVSSSVSSAAASRSVARLGLLGGLVAFRGHHFGAGAVVVVQEQLAQKRLEVPLLHLLAQAGEDVLEAQVGRRVVVGVQPSGMADMASTTPSG